VAGLYSVGANFWIIYTAQILLGLSTVLLVSIITRRAYNRRASIFATLLTALYLPMVFFETKLLSAAAVTLLATLLVERIQSAQTADSDWPWILPGLVLGTGALANPGLLTMAPLSLAWLASDRRLPIARRARRACGLILGTCLLVLPVTVRNHQRSAEWILVSANGGMTFAHGNNPNALGVFSVPPGLSGRIEDQRSESRAIAEERTGRQMGDGAVSRFWFGEGLRYIREQPSRWLRLETSKLMLALASDEQPLEYNSRLDENPFRWLFPVPFALILALASLRLGVRMTDPGPSGRLATPLYLMLLSGLILLLGFYVASRYRVPYVPILAAVAGAGGDLLVERWRRRRRFLAPATVGLVLAAISLAWAPWAHDDLRRQQDAMGQLDRAAAFWETGNREEAIEALETSLQLDPELPERYVTLARILAATGRTEEAESRLREALRRDPGHAQAHFDLGVLLVRSRRLEEAVLAFGTARRLEPDNVNVANNLLGTLLELRRLEEADHLLRDMERSGMAVDPAIESLYSALVGGDASHL
jgi:pentatricopeptide repeat protein